MKELRQMPEGRYGDGKTGFQGQKDIKTFFLGVKGVRE